MKMWFRVGRAEFWVVLVLSVRWGGSVFGCEKAAVSMPNLYYISQWQLITPSNGQKH